MTDCTNLAVGDRVCINGQQLGTVVKVFARYVEAQPVVDLIFAGSKRKYSRRDGFEWGADGFGPRNFILPWDEEKHAPEVAWHELLRARRNITHDVREYAAWLSLEQINEIKAILLKAERKE
jgi:hypothetical protein